MMRPRPALLLAATLVASCAREPECPDIDHPDALKQILEGRNGACELAAMDAFIADRLQHTGPWKQQLRLATSADGLHFVDQGPLGIERAAVGELVVGPDGRYYLFHVDGDLEELGRRARVDPDWLRRRGLPGIGALALAVSEDGRRFQPVGEFGVAGLVLGMVVDPEVVRLADGTWRMYYLGMPIQGYRANAWDEGTPHEVFYAHSTDLVHWHQAGRAAVGPFADPTVRCGLGGDPLSCEMWSYGLDRSTSTDGGLSFAFHGPVGTPGFGPELMDLGDGRHRLVYNDKAPPAPLRSMLSTGEGPWEPEEGERLPGAYGEAPTFARLPDGTWAMVYHSFTSPEDLPAEARHLAP